MIETKTCTHAGSFQFRLETPALQLYKRRTKDYVIQSGTITSKMLHFTFAQTQTRVICKTENQHHPITNDPNELTFPSKIDIL